MLISRKNKKGLICLLEELNPLLNIDKKLLKEKITKDSDIALVIIKNKHKIPCILLLKFSILYKLIIDLNADIENIIQKRSRVQLNLY